MVAQLTFLMHIFFFESAFLLSDVACSYNSLQKYRDTAPYFGINGLSMILGLWSPLHPL